MEQHEGLKLDERALDLPGRVDPAGTQEADQIDLARTADRSLPVDDAQLVVDEVSRTFPSPDGGVVQALVGANLRVRRGEFISLIGPSGCGKSTLGRAILNLEMPTEGSVVLDGEDIAALKGEALRRKRQELQMVFQDPLSSLDPRQSVESLLTEGMRAPTAASSLRSSGYCVSEYRGTSAVTGRPSFVHFARPPSSTATASWPIQRSIHQRRAAIAPFEAS